MKKCKLLLNLISLCCSALLYSQPGSLDSSFSKDGKLIFPTLRSAESLAIQSDGKILARYGFSVARFKSNGTLDKSFGVNGIVSTSFEGYNIGSVLTLQPDGKIILGGSTIDNNDFFNNCLARFTANGIPDSSFGVNGKVTTFIDDFYAPTSIAISSDGKIVVALASTYFADADIDILEYNDDGSVYNEFGYGGTSFNHRSYANAMALQSKGKIVVAGSTGNDTTGTLLTLLRFKKTGLLDNSFGYGGLIILDDGMAAYAMALQSDDKIIILADKYQDSIIARFTKNGLPDSTFGTNGRINPAFRGNALVVQPDSKIIIAGRLYNGSDYDLAIARYKKNGKPDKTFGINGIVTTNFNGNDGAASIALQTDGKIVAGGFSEADLALARYHGDVTLFNDAGNENITAVKNGGDPPINTGIKIYPNPFQSILSIDFSAPGKIQKTISVYNIKGELLLTKATDGNTQLDVTQLTPGTYLIKINDESGKELYNGKVIKQ